MGLLHSKRDNDVRRQHQISSIPWIQEDLCVEDKHLITPNDSKSLLMTSSADNCQRFVTSPRRRLRHYCKLVSCVGNRNGSGAKTSTSSRSHQTVKLSANTSRRLQRQSDDHQEEVAPSCIVDHVTHNNKNQSITNYPLCDEWLDQEHHHTIFDDRVLAELVRQNMAANRVYIPPAKSSRNERRILYLWQRCDTGGITTCGDCRNARVQLNMHSVYRVPDDATAAKTTPPASVSRRATFAVRCCSNPASLDDSGIAVEDHHDTTAKWRYFLQRAKTTDRTGTDETRRRKPSSAFLPTEVGASIRVQRCSDASLTPRRSLCRRQGNERRCVETANESIDRNNAGKCACQLLANQQTSGGCGAPSTVSIRVPRGSHVTVTIDADDLCA